MGKQSLIELSCMQDIREKGGFPCGGRDGDNAEKRELPTIIIGGVLLSVYTDFVDRIVFLW